MVSASAPTPLFLICFSNLVFKWINLFLFKLCLVNLLSQHWGAIEHSEGGCQLSQVFTDHLLMRMISFLCPKRACRFSSSPSLSCIPFLPYPSLLSSYSFPCPYFSLLLFLFPPLTAPFFSTSSSFFLSLFSLGTIRYSDYICFLEAQVNIIIWLRKMTHDLPKFYF